MKETIKSIKEEKIEEREEFERDSSSDFDSHEEVEPKEFNEEAYMNNKLVDFERRRDVKQHEKKETIIESMQKNI